MVAVPAVARIGYLSSDVLVYSSPAFSEAYASLAGFSSQGPKLVSVPQGADVGSTIVRNASNLTSFTAIATSQLVNRLILHLADISSQSVVLHLAVENDLSDVLLLRSAVPFFILSQTSQDAHDNALLASRLARLEKKAVVHVFYASQDTTPVDPVADDKVLPFLLSKKNPHSPSPTNGQATPLGGVNGVNGHANGEATIGPIDDPTSAQLFKAYEAAALDTVALVRRPRRALASRGVAEAQTVVFLVGRSDIATAEIDGVSFVTPSLLSPLPPSKLVSLVPASAKNVIVLEQVYRWSTKWTPLYLDVVSAVQGSNVGVHDGILGENVSQPQVLQLLQKVEAGESSRFQLGVVPGTSSTTSIPVVPKHEAAYTKILQHLFPDRFEVANSPDLVATQGDIATTPEFALGRVRGQLEARQQLISSVQDLLQDPSLSVELHSLLGKWVLAKDDGSKSRQLGKEIVSQLEQDSFSDNFTVQQVLSLRDRFPAVSRWIIGSDAWSYDLGASGLHHAIASQLDVNILIIDTLPYSSRNSGDPHRRKQDVGLYAMNHGDVYVASVAAFSSYAQVLQSLVEADRFKGPSVVLAYLPYSSEASPALEVLKETKLAVDAGYWPLYRWDPSKDAKGQEPFSLDSDAIKNDLRQFLDRQNHLSQLTRSTPALAAEVVSNLGDTIREARKKRAQASYNDLVSALDAPPLLVLYASDGGAAEKKSKRLANRAKARGLSTTIATFDAFTFEALKDEEHVVFVTSTAGQGEPPQNGRNFFKALNAAALRGETLFPNLKYSIYAMGDSHYWPRPEDAHYYNKPGKELDAKLERLGAERVADLGLGDDQDADGSETGYKIWEPKVWKALGVDSVEVTEAEPEPITNEHIKAASGYLRGTIAEGLEDTSTGALAPSDTQLTKFHGIYQQDDRDIRDERQAQGVEPAYSFMIRVRMPGGVCTPQQWLEMDQISDEHGNGTFKITTRATFQFHGIIKRHLKPAMQDINRALLDTLAACGDVNRYAPLYLVQNLLN